MAGWPGRRIDPTPVKDDLGKKISILLWRDISESNVPAMRVRLDELIALTDTVPDVEAGVLLERLERGGDLFPDFEYRLSTPSRRLIRDRLRKRARKWRPPEPRPAIKVTLPGEEHPSPVEPPAPLPVPRIPPLRKLPTLQVLGEYTWTSKNRKLGKKKLRLGSRYLEPFWRVEVEGTARFWGTDEDKVALKGKWEKDPAPPKKPGEKRKGSPKAEFEAKLRETVNLKLEVDLEKLVVELEGQLYKSGPVTLRAVGSTDPDELLKFEFEVKGRLGSYKIPDISTELFLDVTFKGILLFKLDWWEIVKDLTEDLLQRLVEGLGKAVARSLLGRALLALGMGLVTWLLGSGPAGAGALPGPATSPGTPGGGGPPRFQPPDSDIVGGKEAAEITKGLRDLGDAFRKVATDNRRQFALGAGSTMHQLMAPEGAKALADFTVRTRPIPTWLKPPVLNAGTDAWRVWTRTDLTKVTHELVNLATWDFRAQLRLTEKVIVIARAVDPRLFELVKGRAAQISSVAGMAAAVQYAQAFIRSETFEFEDEDGKPGRRDGAQLWALLGTSIHSLKRDPKQLIDDIGEYMLYRLGPLNR